MQTILGIDRIKEYDRLFTGKRIGLITNYSGVNSHWQLNIDLFLRNGYRIEKLFTPEHGLFGKGAGEAVENAVYPGSRIPIISLFGADDKQRPSMGELDGIDLLVYDIQDVGLRYYTYIYTMTYCMEAAAQRGISFVVLDRPNPLGGTIISGGTILPEYASFIGDYGLPVRYGMTPGEVGNFFLDHKKLSLDYRIIELKNYTSDMMYPDTGQLWNVPSPALPDFASTICYAGGCFIGASNISEGRGTSSPFRLYGAPYINMDELYDAFLPQIRNEPLMIRKKAFIPAERKYQGQLCYGLEIAPLGRRLDFIPLSVILMRTIARLYPDNFKLVVSPTGENHLSYVTGSRETEQVLYGEMDPCELFEKWKKESLAFAQKIEPFRIYKIGQDD